MNEYHLQDIRMGIKGTPVGVHTATKETRKDFGMKTANSIKFCNADSVHNYVSAYIVPTLKKYLNFIPSTQSDIEVANNKRCLKITIRLYW